MELIGRRLSAEELRAVLDDPTTVSLLLFGDLDDEDAEMPDPELDLHKSWHALYYLLAGTAGNSDDPAAAAVLGGEDIGDEGGYGPARLLGVETVRVVATALDMLDIDALRARFDPDALTAADIYPGGWARGADDFNSFLAPAFADLCRFYRSAAAQDQAVLLAIV
ncbi:YfbM family protein [Micromonospora sp. NBC_00821]|uniref:YfbM family protein n=1 Tax=Micromonospora sp. NBC_00821 TaxID=2975977 RepID=UPI002ED49878|nr:YfbM family protein [Micromonospora sp. NBC_00821]